MIHVHILSDREFAPQDDIEIRNGYSIGFAGYRLTVPERGEMQLTVTSKSGATQVAIRCLDGEDSNHNIVEHLHPNGQVAKRMRYRGGFLNDGSGGEAALEVFAADGLLISQARFDAGTLHDGPHGEPALTELDEDGRVKRTERYQSGELQDGIGGEPAIAAYDANGQLTDLAHYRAGELLSEHTADLAAARPRGVAPSRRSRGGAKPG